MLTNKWKKLVIDTKSISVYSICMTISLQELSKILDLSPSTISKALNGYSDVSNDTIERVQFYANKLGYQPSSTARNLRLQKTYRIGLVNPTTTFTHDYFMGILKGATIACEAAGYNIVLYTTALDHPEILDHVIKSKEVEGLLIFGGGNVESILNNLNPDIIPIIVVGRQSESSSYSFISPDDIQGSYIACKHLLELGHKKVAFIGQEADMITHTNRLRGYQQALNEFGIHVNQDYIFSAQFLPPGGYIAMQAVLKLHERPTGILCFNDAIAVEGMAALQEEGLRIPEDISMIGFDDSSICERIFPKLTSIQIPLEEIGKKSVEMVLNQIKDSTIPRESVRMPTKLVIRDSTEKILK